MRNKGGFERLLGGVKTPTRRPWSFSENGGTTSVGKQVSSVKWDVNNQESTGLLGWVIHWVG